MKGNGSLEILYSNTDLFANITTMQTDYKELAKQQTELISNLVQIVNQSKKDQADPIQRLQIKVEAQYKSLNCARAQITQMNKLLMNLLDRIVKLESVQQTVIEEEAIFSDTPLLNSMLDEDIQHPLNSTPLEMISDYLPLEDVY